MSRGLWVMLLGISHHRAARPVTSDPDVALFAVEWLQGE